MDNLNSTHMTTLPSRIALVVERAIPGVSLWVLGVLSYGAHRLATGDAQATDSYGAVGQGVDRVAMMLAPVSVWWNSRSSFEYIAIVAVCAVCCVCVARVFRAKHIQSHS